MIINMLVSITEEGILEFYIIKRLSFINNYLVIIIIFLSLFFFFLQNTGVNKNEFFALFYHKLCEKIIKLFEKDFKKKRDLLDNIFKKDVFEKEFFILEKSISELPQPKSCETIILCLKVINKICYYSSEGLLLCFKAGIMKNIEILLLKIEKTSKGK